MKSFSIFKMDEVGLNLKDALNFIQIAIQRRDPNKVREDIIIGSIGISFYPNHATFFLVPDHATKKCIEDANAFVTKCFKDGNNVYDR